MLLFSIYILSLIACGIPDIRSLSKPVKVNTEVLGLNSSVLAFRTPADTTDIQGYALYYKIYYGQSDFIAEKDESLWFDEGFYINDNSEMQPGEVICNERGFIRVGELNADTSSYPAFLITSPPLPSTIVYIDFDSIQHRLGMSDDSPDPIVGFVYPITTIQKTLVRGIIDPTAGTDDSFRSFISDWDFDDGSPADNFHDADLRRRHNKPQSIAKPDETTDFYLSGEPHYNIEENQIPTQWIIGFVVFSYGFDPSNFQQLYSKPEFIGAVGYSPINDTNRPNVTRP